MGAWILDSKLLPPAEPTPWPRPVPAAAAGSRAAIVAIEAGPGAGKTLAMLGLAHAAEAAGARTLWLALDELDAEPATLFAYLVAGMRRLVPGWGAALEGAIAQAADPRLLWRQFFQAAAAALPGGLTLVLDDVHLLGEAPVSAALAASLERLPPGLRVLAATRGRLGWPLQQLGLSGAALALDEAALRFTPAEAEAWLAARAGGGVPETWRAAAARLEGWPLGLALLTASPAAAPVGAPAAGAPPLPAETQLGAYLAEALYAPLDADQRRFLAGLALVEAPDADLARAALEAPDAAERLDALAGRHAVALLADRRTYRIPAPLKAWLQAEAARVLGAAALARLHRRAAAALGDDPRALAHWLAAGAWPEAAAAAEQACPALAAAGRWGEIAATLAALPAELLPRWRGELHAHHGDVPAARAAYARARATADDPAGQVAALAAELTLLAPLADRDPYNRLVPAALAIEAAGRPADRARLQLARAVAAEGRGDVDLRKETYEAVVALPADPDPAMDAQRGRALLGLARVAFELGDQRGASRFLGRAAAIAEGRSLTALAARVAQARAHLALAEADLDGAESALATRPAGFEAGLDAAGRLEAVRLSLAVARAYGQPPADQLPALDALLAQAEALGDRDALAATRLAWAEATLAAGRPEAIPPLLAGPPERWGHDDRALALLAARAELEAGRHAEALARLDALAPALARAEARGLEAQAAAIAAAARPATAPAAPTPAAPTPAAAGGLQVRVLGAFDVLVDGEPRTAWPRRKAKVLLGALLLEPAGRKAFELAELLGEGDPAAGAEIYKVNVRALRQALEPARGKGDDGRFFVPTGGGYALVAAELGACDLRDFDAACDQATRDAARDPAAAALATERALALYGGDLFGDDRAGDYFETEREACRAKARAVARWLAGHRGQAGDREGQAAALEKAWAIAPTDEDDLFTLGEHLVATGQHARLEPLWWAYCKALKQQLGQAPDPDLAHDWQALARS